MLHIILEADFDSEFFIFDRMLLIHAGVPPARMMDIISQFRKRTM